MNRRAFLQQSALATAGLFVASHALGAPPSAGPYPYQLPTLPYAPDALAPYFDAETMRIHHGRHHQSYVDKLNAALATQPDLQADPLEVLFAHLGMLDPALQTALRNHGGGHWNHSFFWPQLTPAQAAPSTALVATLSAAFGSMDGFRDQFGKAALSVFGSGWAWLVRTPEGALAITTTPNQDNPLMDAAAVRGRPLLALDVWEHAYYLNYQNRRADYIAAFWRVVNWAELERRMA